MGKKSPPTAANSGMSKGSILRYVFAKKPSTSNSIPNKDGVGVQKYASYAPTNSNDETSSSDSSAAASPAGPSTGVRGYLNSSASNSENESQQSMSPLAINVSIFDKSEGTYTHGCQQAGSRGLVMEVDMNGNEKNQHMKNAGKHKADSGISDNTTSGESSDEFPIPRIINVETLQRSMPTPVIQYSGNVKSRATNNNKDHASQEMATSESTEVRSQKRNSNNESGSPTSKKKRSESVSSSGTNSSTDSGASGKTKLKDPKEEKELNELIENKRWDVAIPKLIDNVDKNVFPTYLVIAQVINDCIMKNRRTSAMANDLMEKITSTCGKTNQNFEFILQAMGSVSAELDEFDKNAKNCYWSMMKDLIQSLILNAKANCAPDGRHTLRFLNTFVSLLEGLFEEHAKSEIYLEAPMVVRIFEGVNSYDESLELRLQNLTQNVAELAKRMIEVQKHEDELHVLSRLFQLLLRHYYCGRIRRKKGFKEGLLNRFTSELAGSKNYGLPVLGKINDTNFGKDATLKIVETQLKELGKCSAAEKSKFLNCLAKSRIIRKHHFDQLKLRVPRQDDTCRVTKSSNKAGESLLHRLCGDPKKHERLDLTLSRALNEIEKSSTGSVNVPDNGYNFPLHDAADNGRGDQLEILLKRCGPGQTKEHMRINPLLRNNNGDTALHLAAKKGNLKVVQLLVKIIGPKESLELNLDMANNSGVTPMFASTNVQVNEYLQSLQPEAPAWEDDFRFPECKVKLSPESVAKLKADKFLQQVVLEFNCFAEKVDSS